MKLGVLIPLYENVFELVDASVQTAAAKRNNKETGEMTYEEAVKYMAILVGFMLADRATRDNQDLMKRSYTPVGALYRASAQDTKLALDKFWKALGARPLEFGSRDVKTMIQKYYTFLQNGDEEQWKNVAGQLRDYFSHREESVKQDDQEDSQAAVA